MHLAFGQHAHAVHEVVPLRDRDAELFLHHLGIEAGAVRHLNRPSSAFQGDGQGVVAVVGVAVVARVPSQEVASSR